MPHLSRETLLGGVFNGAWKVGDVVGVSTSGAVTMVSFGGGGGSTGSLVWVPADVLVGGSSCFILALERVGGIQVGTRGRLSTTRAEEASARRDTGLELNRGGGVYGVARVSGRDRQ
jgi:hypothetical protein